MTVVVGFYCSDGIVIAADSMITAALGTTPVGHHHGQKIFARNSSQLYAFAGDQGLALRGLYVVEQNRPTPATQLHPLLYAADFGRNTITAIAAGTRKTGPVLMRKPPHPKSLLIRR